MSLTVAALRKLAEFGLTIDQVVEVVEAMEVEPVVDEQAERRRAKDRERKRSLPLNWDELRSRVIERDGADCRYCGGEADPPHIDHIVPLARGGSSDIENLTVACQRCNSSKKDKLLDEWERPTWQ